MHRLLSVSEGYAYLMRDNKASRCLKDLPDCQKDLPQEELLTPKNRKSTAKIYEIPHGKGMLPIPNIRQIFLTTPMWYASDMRRFQ